MTDHALKGSVHANSSTKLASDVTKLTVGGGSQYLGLKSRLACDNTTQGSLNNLRHNVLVPNEHRIELAESQSVSSSTFSIRKHSQTTKLLGHMRLKQSANTKVNKIIGET